MPVDDVVATPAAVTGGTSSEHILRSTGGDLVSLAQPNTAGAALVPTAADEGGGVVAMHVHVAGGGSSTLPANAAQESAGNLAVAVATLASILTKLADPATQTTLAAVLAKQPAAPALESGHLSTIDTATAALSSIISAGRLLTTEASAAAILAKLSSDPATQATLAALLSANHVDLAAILAKQPAAPTIEGGHIATVDTSTAAVATAISGGKMLTTETSASAIASSAATTATQTTTAATQTTTTATNTGTLAGTVSGGKVLTTETSGSAIATSTATTATQTTTAATNTGTIAGAVSAARMNVTDTRLPAALGQATSANSLSVTYPSDKALGTATTDANGGLMLATASTAVAVGAGGQLLAGATGRRIYAITATNAGNTITSNVFFTIGSPVGSFPNFTNLLIVLQPGGGGQANFTSPGSFGFPIGSTALFASASSSGASQSDPTAQPRVVVYYGP